MRAAWRCVAVVVVAGCVALPACSDDSGDSGDGSGSAQDMSAAPEAPPMADLDEQAQDAVGIAEDWVQETAQLDDEIVDSLRFDSVDAAPSVTNVSFTQWFDEHQVRDAELVVHVLADGTVQGATNQLAEPPSTGGEATVDQDAAEDAAGKAVQGMPEEVGPSELVWVESPEGLALAWSVAVTTVDPTGSWEVVIDAASEEVLDLVQTATGIGPRVARAPWDARRRPLRVHAKVALQQAGRDACDPGPSPSACLFIPDPIYGLDGERPRPRDANRALEGRALEGLDDPSHLVGPYVDTEVADATVDAPVEQDGTWAAGRARPGIEHAMAYYWIDYSHRELERLGFGEVRSAPTPVEAVDPDQVDNAQWDGTEIRLGVGSDGINEGEDASGIIHEYGHAVLDEQVPELFGAPDGGAYHEGFGDLLAWLVTLDDRVGDQACLFPWTEEGQCLRRLDSDLVYPDDLQYESHADGMIYTGAIWDVLEALLDEDGIDIEDCPGTDQCDDARDRVLTTLMTSHGYLTGNVTLPDIAAAYVEANEAAFGGEDEDLITEAFAAHGLEGGGAGGMDPTGELPEPTEGIPAVEFDITHSYRGDLAVEVGVEDADGEALCDPILVQRPNPGDGAADLSGLLDVSETDCGELVPPSEDQVWYLTATDTLAQDEGRIEGFTVYDGETPYPAGGLPLPIIDNDPQGTTVRVDGTGSDTDQPEGPGDGGGDGPEMDLRITHSYTGDLSIVAGVLDGDGQALCTVNVLDPDLGHPGNGRLQGTIDLSPCADQDPPGPDSRWYLDVEDTAAQDVGTVDELVLRFPDGDEVEFEGLPAEIPDADPAGVVLVADGERAGPVTGGTSGGDAPVLDLAVDHPYSGDLSVEVGAVDRDGRVLCQQSVATPDPSDNSPDLDLDVPLTDCAGVYPPGRDRRWYLFVADTLARDTGRLVRAVITGPDGATYTADPPGNGRIPDADPTGVVAFFRST